MQVDSALGTQFFATVHTPEMGLLWAAFAPPFRRRYTRHAQVLLKNVSQFLQKTNSILDEFVLHDLPGAWYHSTPNNIDYEP
jgi:hypothetical protein